MQTRRVVVRPAWLRGMLSGVDGPLLEILANGFFLLFYGTYYFYYLPGDLRHFTSIQVVPLYMVMGVILTLLLDYLLEKPQRWHYPAGFYMAGLAFIFVG